MWSGSRGTPAGKKAETRKVKVKKNGKMLNELQIS